MKKWYESLFENYAHKYDKECFVQKPIFALLFIAAIGLFCLMQLPLAESRETKTVQSLEQTNSGPNANAAVSPESENTFIGRIDHILPLDSVIRVVPDDGGQYMYFKLKDAVIAGDNGDTVSFKDLSKGKRVEVKYSDIIGVGFSGAKTAKAVSVSCIPLDYVAQPATQAATTQVTQRAAAQPDDTFVGTIKSMSPVFARPPKWPIHRFTAVNDKGEQIEVYVLRDATTVIDIDGKVTNRKRPQVGKKVEVRYSIGKHEIYGGQRYEALSMRYVPEDYVPQPAASPATQTKVLETPVHAAADNILVGKIVKGGVTFSLRCPYRFVIVTDNGEKKDIWIPRDNMRITGLNGNSVYGAPPRKGRRMEIKYLIGDNGQYEAVSMRYVPEDYVPQSTASAAATQTSVVTAAQEARAQSNIFVGKLETATPVFHHMDKSQPRCKVLVAGDNGKEMLFFVSGLCPVIDASGKDISQTLGNIAFLLKKGERLEIKYSTITNGNSITNGQNGADSIRCLD